LTSKLRVSLRVSLVGLSRLRVSRDAVADESFPVPSPPNARSVLELTHGVLCAVLAEFQPELRSERHGGERRIIRVAQIDRTGVRAGLYGMLLDDFERSETERAPRIGFCGRLAAARRPACEDIFIVERRDHRFCSSACSQFQRSRVYWQTTGNARRRQLRRRGKRGGAPSKSHPWRAR
jgi:hypothetical protein